MWWPFVRGDDVLFHVILLLSSIDRTRMQPQADNAHTRELLDESLGLLNRRVQDPVLGTSDPTMVAIACLAAMEHDRGNMRALDMHLDGLRQIVGMRGGLEAVRANNAMAANMVYWCTMVSIGEPSLLPPSYGGVPAADELQHLQSTFLLTHHGTETDLAAFGLDFTTASTLHEVQQASRLYVWSLEHDSPHDSIKILSQVCVMLQKLLHISRAPMVDVSDVAGLSASCRLAGCLQCVYRPILSHDDDRELTVISCSLFTPISAYFPSPTLLLNLLVRDLKASLTLLIRATGTNSHLLLWLLAVGGVTAHSMPERTWFVGHLAVVVNDLAIETWEDMRQYLVKVRDLLVSHYFVNYVND